MAMKEGKYVGWDHNGQPFNKEQFKKSILKKNTKVSYTKYLSNYAYLETHPDKRAQVPRKRKVTRAKPKRTTASLFNFKQIKF